MGKGSSGKAAPMSTFKFDSAPGRKAKGKVDFPARFNTGSRNQSLGNQLKAFMDRHGGSDKESLIAVDSNGYVTHYIHGEAHSVPMVFSKGDHVIHNHPGGGAFSDADLVNMANTPTRGITALSSRGKKPVTYTVEKGGNFKADSFAKAVKRAQMQGTDYDDAVHRWLTANQKKYGYKYTRS